VTEAHAHPGRWGGGSCEVAAAARCRRSGVSLQFRGGASRWSGGLAIGLRSALGVLYQPGRCRRSGRCEQSACLGAGTPFVDWQGLSTVARGVVGIDLSRTGLSGTMSPALGRLSNLEVLNLHSNSLSGEIPGELGRLGNLKLVALYSNSLSGEIPEELGLLSRLTYLDLGGNSFNGTLPAELGSLAALSLLVIHSSDISGPIPASFGELKKLKRLHLRSNKLTGQIPPELGELEELEVLDLRNNELEGRIPSSLANLRNLTQLHLDGNKLTGRIPTRLAIQLANAESKARERPTDSEITEIYSADPLDLIAHTDIFREYSLGPELWDVWTCDVPTGDLTLTSNKIVASLNKETTGYFGWLSNDRYHPSFQYLGNVQAEDRPGVNKQPRQHYRPTGYW